MHKGPVSIVWSCPEVVGLIYYTDGKSEASTVSPKPKAQQQKSQQQASKKKQKKKKGGKW